MGADRAELDGALDLRAQRQPEQARVAADGLLRHRDGEAAAADAADERCRGGGVQPLGHLAQQGVADQVPERVVDLAEGVDGDGRQHDPVVLLEQRRPGPG